MRTQTVRSRIFRSSRQSPIQRRKAKSRAEVSLKMIVGMVLGIELVGGPALLAMSMLGGFDLVQSPVFASWWMTGFAIVGGWSGVRFLPRFSRDRGPTVDFLIDPRHVRSSLGFYDHPKL